jgi:hypothetical protein
MPAYLATKQVLPSLFLCVFDFALNYYYVSLYQTLQCKLPLCVLEQLLHYTCVLILLFIRSQVTLYICPSSLTAIYISISGRTLSRSLRLGVAHVLDR